MPRKKKDSQPTVEEIRSMKEQVEAYVFDAIMEFERISGLRIDGIDIKRHRPAGFGAKDTIEINLRIEL